MNYIKGDPHLLMLATNERIILPWASCRVG